MASASLAVLLSSCGFAPFRPRAESRRIAFEMRVEAPESIGSGQLRLWVPVPLAGDYQECGRLEPEVTGGRARESYDDKGNRMLYVEGKAPLRVSYEVAVRRFEATPPRKSRESGRLAGDSPWLATTDRARLEDIRKTALFAVASKTLVLDRARVLFDRSIDELVDAKNMRKDGRLKDILANGAGDAFDRNVWFASALRSVGIPSYVEHGWRLGVPTEDPIDLGDAGAWTRFEVPGMGFLPADPQAALDDPATRATRFGGLDEDRIKIGRGREIVLVPRQKGPTLPRFVSPYAELDGADVSARLQVRVRYRDLSATDR